MPAVWNKAVTRIRELGRHAEELGIELALEMYEDTYLGTAESSVRLVEDIGLANVGINADLGNLIRLHRPVEHWQEMMAKVAPYAKYWHVKNYTAPRIRRPASSSRIRRRWRSGIINYRAAIRMALAHGFSSPSFANIMAATDFPSAPQTRDYLRRILPRDQRTRRHDHHFR